MGHLMAKEHTFDISAKISMQDVKDAIMMAQKEVGSRYDFKNSAHEISLNDKALILMAESDNKLDALKDIVIERLIKRGLSSKVLDELKVEDSSGGNRKATFKIVDYIETKEAKKITAEIKKLKLKVTAQIEGDHIRVKGKKLDDLQKVMSEIKQGDWDAPIIFENMR